MSTKKNPNRMSTEKELARLMEELKNQNIESEDELNEFLRDFVERDSDDLPERTDNTWRAQELVYQAYEEPISKGKKLVKQALKLDPNNADAYNYLAELENDIDKAAKLYEKAIIAGEKTLGKDYFKERKGYFWGYMETRPYMRAKEGLAHCMMAKNETDKAIEIFREMLELNPNDNQGVRHYLSSLLLEKNDFAGFELLLKKYEDDAFALWNYNKALYYFKKFGKNAKSNKVLMEAYKSNEFVIDYMLGAKDLPDEYPEYTGFGDKNEAVACVYDTWKLWLDTEGAMEWLFKFKRKRSGIN